MKFYYTDVSFANSYICGIRTYLSAALHAIYIRIILFVDDEEELPLNLSTKNRQIWSPGSACEREKVEMESDIQSQWAQEDTDSPLELVKRCRSSPDEERPSSADTRRCPSAPAYHAYPQPPPPATDVNFSLLMKNENKSEKSFQVNIKIDLFAIYNYTYIHIFFIYKLLSFYIMTSPTLYSNDIMSKFIFVNHNLMCIMFLANRFYYEISELV